ncbi:MAG: AraC family transcriptional regulator [Anaerolineae bacterium]
MLNIKNDLLSQALNLMQITGTLLLKETYAPPWAVMIPNQVALTQLLNLPRDTRIAAFHFVYRGNFELHHAGNPPLIANQGDVVVSFGGTAHTIAQGRNVIPIALEDHLKIADGLIHPFALDEAPTALVCGVFLMRDTHLNPLFAGLPDFLHLEHARLAASRLSLTIPQLLVTELENWDYGSQYAMQRLLELMCLDILRAYLLVVDDHTQGWLQSIKDPILSKALYRFHQMPGDSWSVDRLAAEVNLSSSRFAARFSQALGESCMEYVTKWRLNIACKMLRTTDASVDEIAYDVGYTDLPAFTRVFRRYMGLTPARWRKTGQLHPSGFEHSQRI